MITFEYLTDLTQRAWRFAQREWSRLPSEPIPVFELKTKADEKKLGIGYRMAEMTAMGHDELIFRVIYEVSVHATMLRLDEPKKDDMEQTLGILMDRINAANAAEADEATKN